MRRPLDVLEFGAEGELAPQLVALGEDGHLGALDRAQLLSQARQAALEELSLHFYLLLRPVQPAHVAHCFSPLAAQLLSHNCHPIDLRGFHFEVRVQFLRPVERVANQRVGVGSICEKFSLILGCVEEISIDGRKHGVDDLFEVVVDVGLPFLAVGSDAILPRVTVTLMMSMSKLTRSRSGSSENAILSNSVKVKVCSLEFWIVNGIRCCRCAGLPPAGPCISKFTPRSAPSPSPAPSRSPPGSSRSAYSSPWISGRPDASSRSWMTRGCPPRGSAWTWRPIARLAPSPRALPS